MNYASQLHALFCLTLPTATPDWLTPMGSLEQVRPGKRAPGYFFHFLYPPIQVIKYRLSVTSKRLEPTATANVKHSTSPDTVKNPSPLALASVPTAQDIMLGSQHRLGSVLKDKKNTV